MDEIYTLHYSYPGIWKPSMEEILAIIQDREDLDKIVAVSVEFFEHHRSSNGNIGKTTLYGVKHEK